jgi:hypothetical protein
MSTRSNLAYLLVIVCVLLLGALLIRFLSAENPALERSAQVSALAEADNDFDFGTKSLMGASPEQVGQYALQYVQHHLIV